MFISLNMRASKKGSDTKNIGICSNQEFLKIIDNERLRSDRSGIEFSLITIDIRRLTVRRQILRLIDIVTARIRKIDKIGWRGDQHIGILLPYTPSLGAYKLSENLYELFNDINPEIYLKVHTYPTGSAIEQSGNVYVLNREKGVK